MSQWRAYGQLGGGYVVGVKPLEALDDMVSGNPNGINNHWYFRKVVYDHVMQNDFLSKLMFAYVSKLKDYLKGAEDRGKNYNLSDYNDPKDFFKQYIKSWFNGLREDLLMVSAYFKHPGFSEEKEWRLFSFSHQGDIQIRVANGKILPYLEIPLNVAGEQGKFEIKSVAYGPTNNPQLTEYALRILLDKSGLPGVPVTNSSIPLK